MGTGDYSNIDLKWTQVVVFYAECTKRVYKLFIQQIMFSLFVVIKNQVYF